MVLRSLPAPAWLESEGQCREIVISSRFRQARNLSGYRFPHNCSDDTLREVLAQVLAAAADIRLEVERKISEAERDFLIGCRLISPDFKTGTPGRAVLFDRRRQISVMVNEEDHLRVQALTPGWSHQDCITEGKRVLESLERHIRFSQTPERGFLTASPFNAGAASRISALFHFIGLAHRKRIGEVLLALANSGITARGLFGESSKAVGAFFQVSSVAENFPRFAGACEYLIREEEKARSEVDEEELAQLGLRAAEFAVTSRTLGLADAFRILAVYRWATASKLSGYPKHVLEVDHLISTLEVRGAMDTEAASRDRAETLRAHFEPLLS